MAFSLRSPVEISMMVICFTEADSAAAARVRLRLPWLHSKPSKRPSRCGRLLPELARKASSAEEVEGLVRKRWYVAWAVKCRCRWYVSSFSFFFFFCLSSQ
ncbi:hypothetical protein MUK42_32773 [Musa troglodytarum]|uniref:Uncharacterized protein n=1 Tax=Musa troglodytarum TaxID=320322 RepID=A0A9E7K637_9LILI|nr:hypothetical protein MUK42_32773 [Musa troglodytarum]URE05960.1 hypothetical protein MUK42_32773 [Musa troglodytarum]URE05961.1 hypothetical protein MUK42_32773 [Musa troglodytarum]